MRVGCVLSVFLLFGCHWVAGYESAPSRSTFDSGALDDGAPRDTVADAKSHDAEAEGFAPQDAVFDPDAGWQLLFVLRTTSQAPLALNLTVDKTGDTLRWDLGDGTVIDGNTVSHQYGEPGEKTVRVFSSDGAAGITTLLAHENELVGSIPPELGNLHNLRVLSLSGNGFTGRIPRKLGQLFRLGLLNLEGNALTGDLPSELTQLSDLASLYLSANVLSGYEAGAFSGLSSISFIALAENQLAQAAVDAIVDDIYQARDDYAHLGNKVLLLGGSNAEPSAAACGQMTILTTSYSWTIPNNGC